MPLVALAGITLSRGKHEGAVMNPFPELNLSKLKTIAERWVQRFQKKGGWFNQIVLYRYAVPGYQESTSLRWAVVFDITHFELPDEETQQELIKKCVEGFFLDPYYYFIGRTGYGRWQEDRQSEPKKDHGEELGPISLHGKRFLEQSGFATPPMFVSKEMDFPQNLLESDFTDVYVDGAPENWQNQWLFVPLFKDCPFPDQIQTNESIILYKKLPAKRGERKIVVSPRNEKAERIIWDRWIQPIINTHYNGSIKYRFFDKPEQITQADIENVFRQALSMLYAYPGMPFQGNDFLKEVLDRLLAGFKQHEGVDLVALFYGFLTKLMDDEQLPAFLAYIGQERREDIITTDTNVKRNLRPDQEDRQTCQDIAASLWNKYEILDLKHMTEV